MSGVQKKGRSPDLTLASEFVLFAAILGGTVDEMSGSQPFSYVKHTDISDTIVIVRFKRSEISFRDQVNGLARLVPI